MVSKARNGVVAVLVMFAFMVALTVALIPVEAQQEQRGYGQDRGYAVETCAKSHSGASWRTSARGQTLRFVSTTTQTLRS